MPVPSFYLYHLLRKLCDEYPGIENTPIRTCALQDNYLVLFFDSKEAIESFKKQYFSRANSVAVEDLELTGIILSLYEEPPAPRYNKYAHFHPDALFQNLTRNDTAVARAKEIALGLSTKPLILLGPNEAGKSVLHAIGNHVLQSTDDKTVYYMDCSFIDKLTSVLMSGKENQFREELCSYDYVLLDQIDIWERYPTPARDLFLEILQDFVTCGKSVVLAGNSEHMPWVEQILRKLLPEDSFISLTISEI